jgi:hypothetical protein
MGYSYYNDGSSKSSITEWWDTTGWSNGYRLRNTHNGCISSAIVKQPETDDQKFQNLKDNFSAFAGKGSKMVFDFIFPKKPGALSNINNASRVFLSFSKNKSASSGTTDHVVIKNTNPFTIAPNPAKHYFMVLLKQEIQNTAALKITDMTGKVVLQKMLTGSNSEKIDISEIQKGLYIVTIVSNKSIFNKKLIVQ